MRKNWILIGALVLIMSMALIGCPIEEEKEPLPEITKVFMVGGASDDTGWPPSNKAIELTKGTGEIFSWSGDLKAGYMKFVANEVPKSNQEGIWFTPGASNDLVNIQAKEPGRLRVREPIALLLMWIESRWNLYSQKGKLFVLSNRMRLTTMHG